MLIQGQKLADLVARIEAEEAEEPPITARRPRYYRRRATGYRSCPAGLWRYGPRRARNGFQSGVQKRYRSYPGRAGRAARVPSVTE